MSRRRPELRLRVGTTPWTLNGRDEVSVQGNGVGVRRPERASIPRRPSLRQFKTGLLATPVPVGERIPSVELESRDEVPIG